MLSIALFLFFLTYYIICVMDYNFIDLFPQKSDLLDLFIYLLQTEH